MCLLYINDNFTTEQVCCLTVCVCSIACVSFVSVLCVQCMKGTKGEQTKQQSFVSFGPIFVCVCVCLCNEWRIIPHFGGSGAACLGGLLLTMNTRYGRIHIIHSI